MMVCLGTIVEIMTPSDVTAQQQIDCASFLDPDDAQVAFDADPTDPFGLDGDNDGEVCEEPDGDFGAWITSDEHISARIDGTDFLDTKLDALRRHRSQVKMDGPFFSRAENGQSMWGEEFYRIAKGPLGPLDEDGWESDLFAGL